MLFEQINIELNKSVRSGHIRFVVEAYLDKEKVLTTNIQFARRWLSYSPLGEKRTHLEIIEDEVEEFCRNFVNENYSGELDGELCAIDFAFRRDDLGSYKSEEELKASYCIFDGLMNSRYAQSALEAILISIWPKSGGLFVV